MKVYSSAVAAVALALWSSASWADPSNLEARPSSGTGLLIGGGIATGVGGLNFLTGALECSSSLVSSDNRTLCYGLSFGFGGAAILVGVPLLIVGANQRASYNEWLKDHPAVEALSVVPMPGGGTVGFSASF
jgi:hypothetical protein